MTQNNEEVKLYAGKFKTVEDLEAGYKNSAVIFDENSKLKSQLEEVTKVPEQYLNPTDVELDQNRLSDIQQRAKEAGMTQAQYERFVRNDKARLDQRQQNFEKNKKEVGDETINLLSDYVAKHYPKALHESMLNTFIGNKDMRTAALEHRNQLLNNQVPGMSRTSAIPTYHVSEKDISDAYKQKEKTKSRKDIDKYLTLLSIQANQKQAS